MANRGVSLAIPTYHSPSGRVGLSGPERAPSPAATASDPPARRSYRFPSPSFPRRVEPKRGEDLRGRPLLAVARLSQRESEGKPVQSRDLKAVRSPSERVSLIRANLLPLFVLLACLMQVPNAGAQSPRERISKLRELLKTSQLDEQGQVVPASPTQPIPMSARSGPVTLQLSDQLAPSPKRSAPSPDTRPSARVANAEAAKLPPNVMLPKKKIPLPRTYHGRVPGDAMEPDIGRRGDDPWDLARRLGIADNPSYPIPEDLRHVDLIRQTASDAFAKSEGCIHCHTDVGHMHPINSVQIGCTDCHGGNADRFDIKGAHVWPRFAPAWKDSANPVRSYTILNHESPEFIRFMNPGDLRVAHIACGQCHANEVLQIRKSMMTHGCMLWGAALYNNGGTDEKYSRYGESYSMNGAPQILQTVPLPTAGRNSPQRYSAVLATTDSLPDHSAGQRAANL